VELIKRGGRTREHVESIALSLRDTRNTRLTPGYYMDASNAGRRSDGRSTLQFRVLYTSVSRQRHGLNGSLSAQLESEFLAGSDAVEEVRLRIALLNVDGFGHEE